MRVYELAKELGVGSKELLVVLKEGGFPATSHMVVLSDDALAYLKKGFSKSKEGSQEGKSKASEKTVAQKKPAKETASVASKPAKKEEVVLPEKVNETKAKPEVVVPKQEIEHLPVEKKDIFIESADALVVADFEDLEQQELQEQERIKRLLQGKGFAGFMGGQAASARRRRRRRPRPVVHIEAPKGPVTEITVEKSMALFEVADLFGKPSGDLILYLLKKGLVCNRNHILTLDNIKELGQHFGIAVRVKVAEQPQEMIAKKDIVVTRGQTRWPVVVVMGHVDHGKTTLLDFIRKMNVAATEKGGITQHIRAWEVDSTHGKIVFLDTPGHEAFSYIRQRGSKVTDIVVLVVAVDDGIKPQTVEAINLAKSSGVPIIVAVNKIDKMQSPSGIETVKRQLAQYELMPEEWGGQTIIVPISAKTGQGVNELLEMIVLQSQLMDLKALTDVPASAFVIESHIEKGFGPVATVICKEGVLKQGDYFVCGSATGKVRILVNSLGQRVTQANPSMPVQVVGFDTFSGIGDWLKVVTQQEYTRAKFHKEIEPVVQIQPAITMLPQPQKESKYINLILKTDTRGSKEAIMDSIDKLIKQNKDIKCPINIVSVGIGDVSEGDIDLASNTDAFVLGFNIHVEKNAQLYAKEKQVDIQTYQIIYELIESLEKLLQSKKEIALVWTKVGEAVVKKVFDIKGVGIIAGCYMRDGVLARGNKVVCVRSGKEMGEAKVSTLQRERKPVKEIHAGFECGFTADGFDQWQEGDIVLVYTQTKAE